jgi:glycogen synthase
MRVLMFGWEFPPRVSGGLGVATEGLVRGLVELDIDVTLVLPFTAGPDPAPRLRLISSRGLDAPLPARRRRGRMRIRRIRSALRPYLTPRPYAGERRDEPGRAAAPAGEIYGPNLAREVLRYAAAAGRLAARERFDVIHAHDWMTFLAGMEARAATGRPLVLHVHSTELDRTGSGENAFVTAIERLGLAAADRVVAVSGYTAGLAAREYGVPRQRLRVVHNAIDARQTPEVWEAEDATPLVLFAGRITWQKGPDYFVQAAARVAAERPDARFVVAGAGDLRDPTMDRVRRIGLSRRFFFPGFLPPEALDRLYARADVYVLPSASEPFGLTALEALQHGTPVIVSRTAGVAEVVENVLRVDFGDVEDLASKILSVLAFPPLRRALSARGRADVQRLSWREAASRCLAIYRELVGESR